MNKEELVSVIITTYDTLNLDRAINSILSQTYKNLEIIVVDDNNPDSRGRIKTEEIMRKYKNKKNIYYLKHDRNRNGAVARNTGIAKAKGIYVCFLDDDDFYLPTRIEKSVLFLKSNIEYKGVLTSVLYYTSDKKKYFKSLTINKNDSIQNELFINNNVLGTGSNIFIERKCLDKIQGFDEDFERFQDIEFMIRFLDFFKTGSIDEYLIVKDVKIQNRNPNYFNKKEAVRLFLKKFSSKLNEMDEEMKRRVLYSFNYLLYFSATSRKEINDAKIELKKYGKIGFINVIKKNLIKNISYNNLPRKNKLNSYSSKMTNTDYEYAKKIIESR